MRRSGDRMLQPSVVITKILPGEQLNRLHERVSGICQKDRTGYLVACAKMLPCQTFLWTLSKKPRITYESHSRITFIGAIIDHRSGETESPRCAARSAFRRRKERGAG